MAKLDGQWGGDFSNVTHAVAELQRVVASHQYAVAPSVGSDLRGTPLLVNYY